MKLLSSLTHFLRNQRFTQFNITHKPLLTRDEIFDLYFRIKSSATSVALRDVAHRSIGDAVSIYRGIGLDYDDSRPYQMGDDQRYMNWRLSAKSGNMYMKVFREERRPSVFLVVDRRSNMRFATRTRLKAAQAVRIAAVAGFSAIKHNTSISAVMLDSTLEWVNEARGEQAVFNLINRLNSPCPPSSTAPLGKSEIQMSDVLRKLDVTLTKGSTLYLISDFHDLHEAQRTLLLQLSQKHTVIATHVYDPAEKVIPNAGVLYLSDYRSNQEYCVDTHSHAITQSYKNAAHLYFETIQDLFRSIGIHYRKIATTFDAIEKQVLMD